MQLPGVTFVNAFHIRCTFSFLSAPLRRALCTSASSRTIDDLYSAALLLSLTLTASMRTNAEPRAGPHCCSLHPKRDSYCISSSLSRQSSSVWKGEKQRKDESEVFISLSNAKVERSAPARRVTSPSTLHSSHTVSIVFVSYTFTT